MRKLDFANLESVVGLWTRELNRTISGHIDGISEPKVRSCAFSIFVCVEHRRERSATVRVSHLSPSTVLSLASASDSIANSLRADVSPISTADEYLRATYDKRPRQFRHRHVPIACVGVFASFFNDSTPSNAGCDRPDQQSAHLPHTANSASQPRPQPHSAHWSCYDIALLVGHPQRPLLVGL
jgi:hypothetical protein